MTRRSAFATLAAAALAAAPNSGAAAQVQTEAAVQSTERTYDFEADVPRFAIVISTVSYDDPNLETASVANAERDADRISKLLHAARFDPVVLRNPTGQQIRDSVTSLVERQIRFENQKGLRPVLAVYFAGHGFSAEGRDFITGRDFRKDANIQSGVAISEIERLVSSSADLLVFNDACRTKLDASPTAVGESIDAAGEPPPAETISAPARPDEPRGYASDDVRTLVSYAAQQGKAAKGFIGAHDESSPYSSSLADQLTEQDLAMRDLLDTVRLTVVSRTGRTQYPQVVDGGAGGGRFFLIASASAQDHDRADWQTALATGDAMKIRIFAQRHALSRHSAAAYRWLADHGERP